MIKIVKFEAGIKFKETINIQSCSLNWLVYNQEDEKK
jgi:hypothetical protein